MLICGGPSRHLDLSQSRGSSREMIGQAEKEKSDPLDSCCPLIVDRCFSHAIACGSPMADGRGIFPFLHRNTLPEITGYCRLVALGLGDDHYHFLVVFVAFRA